MQEEREEDLEMAEEEEHQDEKSRRWNGAWGQGLLADPYRVRVITYAAVVFLCHKACAGGKPMIYISFLLDESHVYGIDVSNTLRGHTRFWDIFFAISDKSSDLEIVSQYFDSHRKESSRKEDIQRNRVENRMYERGVEQERHPLQQCQEEKSREVSREE